MTPGFFEHRELLATRGVAICWAPSYFFLGGTFADHGLKSLSDEPRDEFPAQELPHVVWTCDEIFWPPVVRLLVVGRCGCVVRNGGRRCYRHQVDWHLAQVNVGRLQATIGDPKVAEFVAALDDINSLADSSHGFVWRLQSADGDATGIRVSDDERVIINASVWTSLAALSDFVFASRHREFLRRRREWFESYGGAYQALWWVPVGYRPTLDQALERIEHIATQGVTSEAFTFQQAYPPPGEAD